MTTLRTFALIAALSVTAHGVSAQIPNASAGAYGMAGNYVATARGYDAVAWNPALLGVENSPVFSLSILGLGATGGLNPVKLADIADFYGKKIDSVTKEKWLHAIGSGTETGDGNLDVSILALSIWKLGFQVGVSGSGNVNLNQDAAELLLYGNAGRTGVAKTFNLNGSSANASTFGVAAASISLPIPFTLTGAPDEQFSFGATGKYVQSIFVARGKDNGSQITPSSISLVFPVITIQTGDSASGIPDAGHGMGLDLGVAWSAGNTTISGTVRNVVNTFKWNTTALRTRSGAAFFDGSAQDSTSFAEQPYSAAPAAMRAELEAEKFEPEFALGISHRVSSLLLVTADGSKRMSGGIDTGPESHVGVGAELTIIPFIPLRAGVAAIQNGYLVAGGLGLNIGPLEISGGVSLRQQNGGSDYGAMISLISIR
jgi:hypothetical protein